MKQLIELILKSLNCYGQINNIKLNINEITDSQSKQSESKADLWKQIIIIVVGSLIVSLTAWISSNVVSSIKSDVYKNIKQEQLLNPAYYKNVQDDYYDKKLFDKKNYNKRELRDER